MKECKEESFVFYASFYDALLDFPEDVQFAVLKETARYGIYGGEPRLTGISAALFKLIRPQLDANRKRRAVGRSGGAPKGNKNAKKKTEGNEEKTTDGCIEKQPNENVNVNVNENENVNEVMLTHNVTTRKQRFDAWLEKECPYIAKRYKLPTDKQLERLCAQYGEQMVAEVCGQLENRADLRKRYTDLYRTMLNWCKREKEHEERRFNENAGQRADEYASVIAEFRNNSEVRQP